MGRKNNKVRQLDGLGLDFDDMFGGGVSKPSKPSAKPQAVKPTERKEEKLFRKRPFSNDARDKARDAVDRATVRRSRRVFARHVLAFSLATKCRYAENG